uniref:Uncharacterized protein n=1 Tax=Knipowitschia caucasica TaxID=637954 RepID=A0AAV2JDH4_KNICA
MLRLPDMLFSPLICSSSSGRGAECAFGSSVMGGVQEEQAYIYGQHEDFCSVSECEVVKQLKQIYVQSDVPPWSQLTFWGPLKNE